MTALGTGIWYHLIARYPAALVSPFLLLVPVVAILGGILILGEELRSIQTVGGSLIVLGVAVVVTGRGARETTGRQTGT
jgi:O-acetylserine/cysteine efflux transporter